MPNFFLGNGSNSFQKTQLFQFHWNLFWHPMTYTPIFCNIMGCQNKFQWNKKKLGFLKKIVSPSLGLWVVQNPREDTQTLVISGKWYPTWPCFVLKKTARPKKGIFLTTKHGHVGYRFPLISWVWVSSRGFRTTQRPREGDPIFFKKPNFQFPWYLISGENISWV